MDASLLFKLKLLLLTELLFRKQNYSVIWLAYIMHILMTNITIDIHIRDFVTQLEIYMEWNPLSSPIIKYTLGLTETQFPIESRTKENIWFWFWSALQLYIEFHISGEKNKYFLSKRGFTQSVDELMEPLMAGITP